MYCYGYLIYAILQLKCFILAKCKTNLMGHLESVVIIKTYTKMRDDDSYMEEIPRVNIMLPD